MKFGTIHELQTRILELAVIRVFEFCSWMVVSPIYTRPTHKSLKSALIIFSIRADWRPLLDLRAILYDSCTSQYHVGWDLKNSVTLRLCGRSRNHIRTGCIGCT